MRISLIVAMTGNGVIGIDNRMPWHLPADLRRFRGITLGKPILMGRRTHESIGRPLPGRLNIVLSANPAFSAPGCRVVSGLEQALAAAGEAPELMVIGGARLYADLLPRAERLYLTLIHHDFEGDTFFPEIDWSEWREIRREDEREDGGQGWSYSFIDLDRIGAPAPGGG